MPKVDAFEEDSKDNMPEMSTFEEDDGLLGRYEDEDEDEFTLADLMQTFFASEDGKNIVDTLQGIKKGIDTNNKILAKLAASLESSVSKQ